MIESTCSLIRKLLKASSIDEQIQIFVSTPNLDPKTFLVVCQDGQKYGFSRSESAFLRSRIDQFSRLLLALSGELQPSIPSILYGKIGMAHRLRGNVEQAKTYYLYAFNTAANNEEKAMALSSYGILEMQQGSLRSAESTLKRALKICEDHAISGATYVTITNNLGLIAMGQANYDIGVEYFEETSACAKRPGLFQRYIMAQLNLAELHRRNHQYTLSHKILDEIEIYVKGAGSWAEDALYALRNRLREEENTRDVVQHGEQQFDVILNLMERACQDVHTLQELKQKLHVFPYPMDEIMERSRKLFPKLYRQNPEGCYRVALLLRGEALDRESAAALAEITYDLCLHFEYSTSEERIQWLEEAFATLKLGDPTVLAAVKAMLSEVAANEYIRCNSPNRKDDLYNAIHYWTETLQYLEGGSIYAKPIQEMLSGQSAKEKITHIHYNVATSYNELYSIERDPHFNEYAIKHFNAALAHLPNLPKTEEMRTRIQVNLGNALAFAAQRNLSLIFGGQADRANLLESLQVQSNVLERLRHRPSDYFNALINIAQTYIDLAIVSKYADRSEYFRAASQCLAVAKRTLQDLPAVEDNHQVLWISTEARLVLNNDSGEDDLRKVGGLVHQTLPLMSRTSLHERAIGLYALGSDIWERLGDRPRAYRYLLKGLFYLYDLQLSGQLLLAGTGSKILQDYFNDLISRLLKWGETERALFFLNQCISIGWHTASPEGKKPRPLLPRRTRWVARKGQTVIQFWLSFKTYPAIHEFVAFIINPEGLKYHRYDFDYKEVVHAWIEFAEVNNRYKSSLDTNPSDLLYQVQLQNRLFELKDILVSIGSKLGKFLFSPLEPLLPIDGELVIVPDGLLRALPLHLASFEKQGEIRSLTDLYDVVYCEYVDTESRLIASGQRNAPAMISFLSFYPPEAPLPFSYFEAIAVADTIDPAYLNQKLGREASVESLVESLRTADIVHLCCHGNYFLSSPLDSSFLLADNTVSVHEVQLRLYDSPCSLIVLSACESGRRGSIRSYEDAGFSGTLLNAGCQTVIGAMWRTKDISTAFLMGEFYNGLAQAADSAPVALCRAQRWLSKQTSRALISKANELLSKHEAMLDPAHRLEIESGLKVLLDSEGVRPFENPVYWAAFFAVEEKVSLISMPRK